MIETLLNFFKQSPNETKGKVPEGLCPNCWGNQAYDGKIRDMYHDQQISVKNHEENYSFIQKFVIRYIDGIRLVNVAYNWECPTCREVQ